MLSLNRVSNVDKVLFTKHLSVMIRSGIVITEAIQTLIPETKSLYFKSVLSTILKDIENGQTLSKSMAKFPAVFDRLYVNLVKIGEESGTLDVNLIYLSEKLRKEYSLKKKVQSVMVYPSIVVVAAILIGGYISFFVLPQLLDFFSTLNVPLPLTTKILLWFAWLVKYYGFLLTGAAIVIVWLFAVITQTRKVRPYWHRFLLKIPIYGSFIRNANLAELFRNLGIMLRSGLTIVTALTIEKEASDNEVFRDYIGNIASGLSRGKSMADFITEGSFSHIPPLAVKMIAVGEKTGKLEESFAYLGDFFEEELDSATKNISALIEPVIVVVIGIVVLFLAFSIISPIYQLTGSIHK